MKKITKRDLADVLTENFECSTTDGLKVVDEMLNMIKECLSSGGGLEIRGFGSMRVVERKAKKGQDIGRGKTIVVPSTRKPVFKPSRDFVSICNQ